MAVDSAQVPPLGAPALPARPSTGRGRMLPWVAGVLVLALCVFAWIDVGGSVSALVKGLFAQKGIVRDVIPNSVPPDGAVVWSGAKAAVTTLCIAVLSIALGIVGAIAMLPLAARNITPSRPLYEVARILQAVLRAIPELITLLFFLITVGFGPWSATVACATRFWR